MDVKGLLEAIGAKRIKLVGDKNYVIRCMSQEHSDRSPSLNVMVDAPYLFNCWGCHWRGNIVRLVQDVLNLNPLEAYKFAEKYGYKDFDFTVQEKPKKEPKPLSADMLARLVWLKSWRGLKPETLKAWKLAYDPVVRRVIFPVHGVDSKVIGFIGRTVEKDVKPKYLFYDEFPKGGYLFNVHRTDPKKPVLVVEGNYDAIRLWDLGFPNVVALMGSWPTDAQLKLLRDRFKEVWLALDNDKAGQYGTLYLAKKLRDVLKCFVLPLPEGVKDPGEFKDPKEVHRWILHKKVVI